MNNRIRLGKYWNTFRKEPFWRRLRLTLLWTRRTYFRTKDQASLCKDDIKDCYPGFTITCKCGSKNVYVENTLGFSSPSGPWGSVDLVCNDCGYKTEIADPFGE